MQCAPFRVKFGVVALGVQLLFAILFASVIDYDARAQPKLPKPGDEAFNESNAVGDVSAHLASKYPGKPTVRSFC